MTELQDFYVDRATQTDTAVLPSHVSGTTKILLQDAQEDSNVSMSSLSSLIIHTRPPTPATSEGQDRSTENASPPASIQNTTRIFKRPQAVYLRPIALDAQTSKFACARVVSLPETVSKYSAKQNNTGRRIVSMPEPSGNNKLFF
jgi:hypothetical protein